MVDNFTKIVDSLARLIGVLTWPIVLIVACSYFAPSLQTFLANLKEGSIEGLGWKISGKSQAEATAAIANASVSRLNLDKQSPDELRASQEQISKSVAGAAKAVDALSSAASQVARRSKQILWVDDTPTNNVFEKQAFEALGFSVTNALTTDEALDAIKRRKFDLIISDMGRPEGRQAGYDLLQRIKEIGLATRFIIYSSSNTSEMRAEAIRRGAFASTNHPDELLHLAADALTRS